MATYFNDNLRIRLLIDLFLLGVFNPAFQLVLETAKKLRYPRCVADHRTYCVHFTNTNKVEYVHYIHRWSNGIAHRYPCTEYTNTRGHRHEVQFWSLKHLMPHATQFSTSLMNGQP